MAKKKKDKREVFVDGGLQTQKDPFAKPLKKSPPEKKPVTPVADKPIVKTEIGPPGMEARAPTTPEIIRTPEGRPSGIVDSQGRTFMGGLTTEEIREIAERDVGSRAPIAGTNEFAAEQAFRKTEQSPEQFLEEVKLEQGELSPTAIQREFTEGGGQLTEEGLPVFQPTQDEEAIFTQGLKDLGYSDEQIGKMVKIRAEGDASLASSVNTNFLLRMAFQSETSRRVGLSLGRVWGPFKNLGGDFIGVQVEDVQTVLTNGEDAEQLEGALGKLGETFSGIRGLADANGVSTVRTIAQLEQQQSNVAILEFRIRQAAILEPALKQTGRYTSILAELDKTKIELQEVRADVLKLANEERRINVPQVQEVLEELEK